MGGRSKISRAGMYLSLALLVWLASGCSVKKIAINKLGDALSAGGATFSSDNDPQLVKEALPFSLKLMESLLAESPRHEGLLLGLASGFTQYGVAFVEEEGNRLEDEDLDAAMASYARAKKLYLRARDYGLRGLEVRHAGFRQALFRGPKEAVKVATVKDVPLLYWTAAAWGSAISLAKDDPERIAEQGSVEALIDRAFELQPDWNEGAIHGFLIAYEMSRQGAPSDPAERARKHFTEAVELSEGRLASPYVTFAEAVALERQNRKEFEHLLRLALAIDPDTTVQYRLVNILVQDRAHWLLGRLDELFFEPKTE